MKILERIRDIESSIILGGDYTEILNDLKSVENDFDVYRHLGTPVWKIEDAKKELKRIREWIAEEIK